MFWITNSKFLLAPFMILKMMMWYFFFIVPRIVYKRVVSWSWTGNFSSETKAPGWFPPTPNTTIIKTNFAFIWSERFFFSDGEERITAAPSRRAIVFNTSTPTRMMAMATQNRPQTRLLQVNREHHPHSPLPT